MTPILRSIPFDLSPIMSFYPAKRKPALASGRLCRREVRDKALQLIDIEWLDEVPYDAQLVSLVQDLQLAVGGHDDHTDGLVPLANIAKRLQTIHSWHLHVEEDEVRSYMRQYAEGFDTATGGMHLVA